MNFLAKLSVVSLSILITFCTLGQNAICDDYSSPADWNQVNSGTTITNGALHFNGCNGQNNRRIFKKHGVNLSYSWKLNFDFIFSKVGAGGPGHILAALTNGNLDPVSELQQSQWVKTNQDAIYASFASTNGTNNANTFYLMVISKKGTTQSSPSPAILLKIDTQYYISMERFDETHGRLSVFMNPQHTVSAGEICFTILPNVAKNLTHLQHGVISYAGVERDLTAKLDNTCLANIELNGGTIGGQQIVNCGSTPSPLTNKNLATGPDNTFQFTYTWEQSHNPEGNWTPISGANQVSFTPQPVRQKTWYRRVAHSGCGTTLFSNAISIQIKEAAPLNAGFRMDINCQSLNSEFSVNAMAITTAGENFNWKWTISEIDANNATCCNEPVSLAAWGNKSTSFETFKFMKGHRYQITRTIKDQCTETGKSSEIVECKYLATDENKELDVTNGLKIYPNPSKGTFQIQKQNETFIQNGKYIIYDSRGKIIASGNIESSIQNVDIISVQTGIYYCDLLVDGQKIKTEKIVIVH